MYLEFFHGGGVRTPQSKSEEKAPSDSLSGSYLEHSRSIRSQQIHQMRLMMGSRGSGGRSAKEEGGAEQIRELIYLSINIFKSLSVGRSCR